MAIVFIVVLLVGVGYATVVNTYLSLNGQAQATADYFNVYFTGEVTKTYASEDYIIVEAEPVALSQNATVNILGLSKKGDSSYTILEIENASHNVDADISVITNMKDSELMNVDIIMCDKEGKAISDYFVASGQKTYVKIFVELLNTPTNFEKITISAKVIAKPQDADWDDSIDIPEEYTLDIDKELIEQDIDYTDSLDTLQNPDRGWYRAIPLKLGNIDSYNIQAQCTEAIEQNISIIHLRIDIGELSGNSNSDGVDKDFTSEQLDSLNNMLDTIRKNKLSVIVRFAYDYDGNTGKAPQSFETIKSHIKQLKGVLNDNKDIISTLEAGFLGLWGEMHTAGEYQEDKYYKELIEILLENTPKEMTINVRKPYFYKLVVGELNNYQKRLGIFNDGYLGSATDLGTFDNDISRNDFIDWMQIQGQYTLYGGEVTRSGNTNDEKYSDIDFALEEMPKTHTAYLNSQHNVTVINKWKNQNYISVNSEYDGQTAYKYITDHLGYRLVVRNSKISSSVEKGDICGVNLEIENVGFGNIIKTQKVSVILRKDSDYYETALNINANNINSGAKKNIKFYFYVPSDIEDGEWQVYLKIANKNLSDYAIKFANPNMWESTLKANCIGKVTIENSVAEVGVKIKQAFSSTAIAGNKGELPKPGKPKIPVTFAYYKETDGRPNVGNQTLSIELGTEIDFKDANALSSLGITIPEGYKFLYAQCYAITADWGGYSKVTIPSQTSESTYYILVYVANS